MDQFVVVDAWLQTSNPPCLEHPDFMVYDPKWWRPKRMSDELSVAPRSGPPLIFLAVVFPFAGTSTMANHGGVTNILAFKVFVVAWFVVSSFFVSNDVHTFCA